jgi:hypothetical protein
MISDAADLLRVVVLIPEAEVWRRYAGPRRCVAHFRRRGRACAVRSPDSRRRLRRVIRAIDGRLPDGGNCYRRALIEIALDPVSAGELLHFGLIRGGGRKSGHAWLSSDQPSAASYDAEFTI